MILSDIVKSNYYSYGLYSGCVEGLEALDEAIRGKCMAEAHNVIIRSDD